MTDSKRTLHQNILSAHKEGGQKWIDRLPFLVQELTQRWQLHDLIEYGNLSWNYVLKARQGDRWVVLKMSYDLPALQMEVNALKVFSKGSSVEVLDYDEPNIAVLLEAAHPGKDLLGYSFHDPLEAMKICCDLAQDIQKAQRPSTFSFLPIENEFKNLEKDWSLPPRIIETARRLKKELLASPDQTHIIHGDLHRGNILSHQGGWRAIDPKGYVGTLYNEVWPFVHHPKNEIPWIAKTLGLEESKLARWCFLHSVLAATWCLEDGINPRNVLNLAEAIEKML